MKRLYIILDTNQEIFYYIGFNSEEAWETALRLYKEKTRIGVRIEDQKLPIEIYGYEQGEMVLDQYLKGVLLPPDRIFLLYQIFDIFGYCMKIA